MDEDADWLSAVDEPEPEPTPAAGAKGAAAKGAAAKGAAAKGAAAAPAAGEAPAEEAPAVAEAEAADEYLDPDKLLLFKHWIRPKYLPYKYLYDYRRSYYDDVIEVIESRRKGFRRDIPRAQTWAERVLRTYKDPLYRLETFDRFLEDVKLVTRCEVIGKFYTSQSLSSFNKRYSTRITY